ncbi:ATP-binding cassette domain-containing protein, partial [Lacticaseibacillus rhamnosus]
DVKEGRWSSARRHSGAGLPLRRRADLLLGNAGRLPGHELGSGSPLRPDRGEAQRHGTILAARGPLVHRGSGDDRDFFLGRHQLRNVALAIATAEELSRQGFPVTASSIERGIRETHWPGRFQVLPASAAVHPTEVDLTSQFRSDPGWGIAQGVIVPAPAPEEIKVTDGTPASYEAAVERLEEIIDFLDLQSVRKATAGTLPYGLRKRVELARAMALEPQLFLLDEPMAGMNFEEK